MESRRLGATGLVVSPIGFGLAALGRPAYINIGHARDMNRDYDAEAMRERAHTVLDAAWNAGVRSFDAARSYGRAEEFLASWLASRGILPAAVTVASKWGYIYTARWRIEADEHEVKDHSLAVLERQLEESRSHLGAHLDLYQIHSATLESGVLENREVLGRLARLRMDEGVKIGVTVSGPRQAETLRRAIDLRIGGERLFDCVQATWNLLERSAEPALQAAHEAGIGVIVKEGLANGRLATRNDDPSFSPKRRRLETEASRLGTTLDALALAAVLARPWTDVVLSGATTIEQLRSNLAAAEIRWSPEAEERLLGLAESPEEYWTIRARLPWN